MYTYVSMFACIYMEVRVTSQLLFSDVIHLFIFLETGSWSLPIWLGKLAGHPQEFAGFYQARTGITSVCQHVWLCDMSLQDGSEVLVFASKYFRG